VVSPTDPIVVVVVRCRLRPRRGGGGGGGVVSHAAPVLIVIVVVMGVACGPHRVVVLVVWCRLRPCRGGGGGGGVVSPADPVVVVVVMEGGCSSSRVTTFVCFSHAPRDAGIIYCLNNHALTCPVSSVGWRVGIQRPRGLEFDSRCKTLYFKYD
jgi:hypothetical protein